jgi:hypothetical protein
MAVNFELAIAQADAATTGWPKQKAALTAFFQRLGRPASPSHDFVPMGRRSAWL